MTDIANYPKHLPPPTLESIVRLTALVTLWRDRAEHLERKHLTEKQRANRNRELSALLWPTCTDVTKGDRPINTVWCQRADMKE